MKTFILRTALVIVFPFIMLGSFFSVLLRGIRDAFWYAAQEVRIEFEMFCDLMKERIP